MRPDRLRADSGGLRFGRLRAATTAPPPPPAPVSVGPTSTPTVTASLDPAVVAALNDVLAGEHAVVWAYGALGPRLDEAGEERARQLLAEHQRTRDDLRAEVLGVGGSPVPAEAAYQLPTVPGDPVAAAALARLVEERLAAVYGDLVAAAGDVRLRTVGVTGLVEAALRAASWGATDATFPGLPEHAPA